jgi:hypothetical protein
MCPNKPTYKPTYKPSKPIHWIAGHAIVRTLGCGSRTTFVCYPFENTVPGKCPTTVYDGDQVISVGEITMEEYDATRPAPASEHAMAIYEHLTIPKAKRATTEAIAAIKYGWDLNNNKPMDQSN